MYYLAYRESGEPKTVKSFKTETARQDFIDDLTYDSARYFTYISLSSEGSPDLNDIKPGMVVRLASVAHPAYRGSIGIVKRKLKKAHMVEVQLSSDPSDTYTAYPWNLEL